MHAARMAAAHSALLALLVEHETEAPPLRPDSIHAVLRRADDGVTLDLVYTRADVPVGGEGC